MQEILIKVSSAEEDFWFPFQNDWLFLNFIQEKSFFTVLFLVKWIDISCRWHVVLIETKTEKKRNKGYDI